MMKAPTRPTTWSNVRSATTAPFKTRTDSLICVLDHTADVGRLRNTLAIMGISNDQVEVLHGADGLNRLGASQPAPNVLSVLLRRLRALALGPEVQMADRYARILHGGDLIIAVRDVDRDDAGEILDILAAHGAQGIHHYGRFTIAYLSSPGSGS